MIAYWIEYTDGKVRTFEVESAKEALWYFKNEGDHAVDFGELELKD